MSGPLVDFNFHSKNETENQWLRTTVHNPPTKLQPVLDKKLQGKSLKKLSDIYN